jgi:hypothetical protein
VTLIVVIIVVVLAVLGFGYLIYRLMRGSQDEVPRFTDGEDAKRDPVVGTDAQGQEIRASQEPQEPARDEASFDALLKDEIHDLGREEPAADDE